MIKEISLRVAPRIAADETLLAQQIARQEGMDKSAFRAVRIVHRSIDARQRDIYVNVTARVYVDEEPPRLEYPEILYPDVSDGRQVVVVGAGPGGLFAALRLIELGLRPVVLERGKDVHSRRRDIALISREHRVDDESNYAFGEGGAGAFSDGKLYTRSTKRGNVDKVLQVFCQHGADTSILIDAHPHIGTDRLPRVIEAMRETIRRSGGKVRFETRVDGLLYDDRRHVRGVLTREGEEITGPVILATGHSARDVYRFLYKEKVALEMKGLAIGVRLEHPSHLIDCIMYHNRQGRGQWLPAAEYRMTARSRDRGVYSFCMCPGGFVIPAASGQEQVVVNGMSPSGRNSRWSNSGMVVEMLPEEWGEESLRALMHESMADNRFASLHEDMDKADNPLLMMYLQEALERKCWMEGGQRQTAPAQRMTDFIRRRPSRDLPQCSYSPGVVSSPLHGWMPAFLTSRLAEGFSMFGRRYQGFLTEDALMIAVETRTSSPVRIVRDRDTLQHVTAEGLYPCGEGAGYAGGIVSAAIDGERCAEAVATSMI